VVKPVAVAVAASPVTSCFRWARCSAARCSGRPVVSLFQSGANNLKQESVRQFEHRCVVEMVFAVGVFGMVAGRPTEQFNAFAPQVGGRGVAVGPIVGDDCQVVQPGAIVVILSAIGFALEPEGALAAVRDPENASLFVDRLLPEEIEEVLVESCVLVIDVEDLVPKVYLHDLLSRANQQTSSQSLIVVQISTFSSPSCHRSHLPAIRV
jgi:hypothetical protein